MIEFELGHLLNGHDRHGHLEERMIRHMSEILQEDCPGRVIAIEVFNRIEGGVIPLLQHHLLRVGQVKPFEPIHHVCGLFFLHVNIGGIRLRYTAKKHLIRMDPPLRIEPFRVQDILSLDKAHIPKS